MHPLSINKIKIYLEYYTQDLTKVVIKISEINTLNTLSKEIIDAIQSICNDLKLDRTIPCTIHAVYEPDEKQNLYRYDVVLNDSVYKLYSSTNEVYGVHNKVWVTYPCGDLNKAYISGRRFVKYGNTCYK